MKRQRLYAMVIGLLIAGAAVTLLSGDQGLATFYRTWRQIKDLRKELTESQKTIDSLKVEIDRLRNDTAHIERIAREKYGMTRENEKMYKFIEEKQ
jgi:cell division protein FtsB